MSSEPNVQPQASPLQFDRAVHADPSAAPVPECARCTKPIAGAYYHDGDTTLCAGCGKVRQHTAVPDRSVGTLVRAAAFGAGAAVVGALLYYGVMAYLELEIGIVAIAIGWLVGRAVAKATSGRSARRHQMLALSLTYLSVAFAYAPFAIKEWRGEAGAAKAAAASAASGASAFTTPAMVTPSAAVPAVRDSAPAGRTTGATQLSLGAMAFAFVATIVLVLALPVVAALGSMPGGILSILIIGFGMRQAWTMAAASNAVVTGPHAIEGAAAV